MTKIKNFLTTTLLGGVIILLPVLLTGFFLHWLYEFITGLIFPLTELLAHKEHLPKYLADLVVVGIIITICFIVGLATKTKVGTFLHDHLERRILKIMPGYSLFRETVKQFLGQEKTPFSRVVLVRPFGNSTLMTGFVTQEHPDGRFTVYVPSGLNPTSGMIFHLDGCDVHAVDVSVEDTMRSIISCGAGSTKLLQQIQSQQAFKG